MTLNITFFGFEVLILYQYFVFQTMENLLFILVVLTKDPMDKISEWTLSPNIFHFNNGEFFYYFSNGYFRIKILTYPVLRARYIRSVINSTPTLD